MCVSDEAHYICFLGLFFTEEAAADDKRGKLYKPKSKILEAKTFLPLETPPQFLALDKRNVSFTQFLLFFPYFSLHLICFGEKR